MWGGRPGWGESAAADLAVNRGESGKGVLHQTKSLKKVIKKTGAGPKCRRVIHGRRETEKWMEISG